MDQNAVDSSIMANSPYLGSEHNTESQLVQMTLKGRSSSIDAASTYKGNRNQSRKSNITGSGKASDKVGATTTEMKGTTAPDNA